VAAPLVAAAIALCALRDLEGRPPLTVAVLALAVAGFAVAIVRLGGSSVPTSALVAVAAVLRCLLLPLPPTLSDDVYRYIWDGRITVAGWNPYFHAPDDPALASVRDELWERVAHRDVETVYPPLAIAAFSIAGLSRRPLLAWKALLAAVDLVSCLLLVRLARARGVPTGRVVAYAWNPLVALEIAGMGHVDGLGVAPLVGAALLLERSRGACGRDGAGPTRDGRNAEVEPGALAPIGRAARSCSAAGALVGLAVLAKIVPVLLAPAWTGAAGRRALFALACAGVVVLGVAPFLVGAPGAPPGLVTYAVSWEFNGPLFEPLWRALDAIDADDWVKARLGQIERATGDASLLTSLYRYVYPQLLAKVLLGLALAGVVGLSLRRRDPVRAALWVFGGMLVLSATVYPWYLLWVLPWAALSWSIPWLVLSSSILAAYLPRLFDVPLLPWPFLSVWGPLLIASAASATRRRAPPIA
jgi:hypothetical protein